MAENPNVALHRKGHEAFSRGDKDTLAEVIAEETVWHTAGRSLISGEYSGRDAVFAFLEQMAELTSGTLEIEDQYFLGNGDRTVALFRFTATRGDKTLNADLCEVVRWRDDRVIEEWLFAFDQYTYDEFWS